MMTASVTARGAESVGAPVSSVQPPASAAPEANDAWQRALARAPQKGLVITSGAADYARDKLAKRGTPSAALRLGIKGGGCSGFSYVIQFEDGEPKERDYAY